MKNNFGPTVMASRIGARSIIASKYTHTPHTHTVGFCPAHLMLLCPPNEFFQRIDAELSTRLPEIKRHIGGNNAPTRIAYAIHCALCVRCRERYRPPTRPRRVFASTISTRDLPRFEFISIFSYSSFHKLLIIRLIIVLILSSLNLVICFLHSLSLTY